MVGASEVVAKKAEYKVVVLGNTGVGKSSLLNMFAGSDVFQVGEGAMSETSLTAAHDDTLLVGKTPDTAAAKQLRLIDTQDRAAMSRTWRTSRTYWSQSRAREPSTCSSYASTARRLASPRTRRAP